MHHILIHSPEGEKALQQNAKYCALVYLPNRKKYEFYQGNQWLQVRMGRM